MVRITAEEVYRGGKYGVMSDAIIDYLSNGRPAEYDLRKQVELLIVKSSLINEDKKLGRLLRVALKFWCAVNKEKCCYFG